MAGKVSNKEAAAVQPALPDRDDVEGPRNILLFSDGTGNSSSKLQKTNVWRLYEALDLGYPVSKSARKAVMERKGPDAPDAHDQVQIAYYDNGVGTSTFKLLAILGGVFGFGLARNIHDLYKFLCRNYRPANPATGFAGDRIYAFGFSRGAYTIRLLVGLIATMGVVLYDNEAALDRRARDMWREYRRDFRTNNPVSDFVATSIRAFMRWTIRAWRWAIGSTPYAEAVRQKRSNCYAEWFDYWRGWPFWRREQPTTEPLGETIEFVGVWDTVAAYGGPIVELTRMVDEWVWPLTMPNYRLSPKVRQARHAMAIDDKRDAFHPLPWDETYETDQDAPQPRLQQVWFAGMHADVGGGYADDALSYVSLFWMIEHAEQSGVRLLPDARQRIEQFRNTYGPLHDSRSGGGAFYRYQPRYISAWVDFDPPRHFGNDTTVQKLAHVRPGTGIFRDQTIDRARYRTRGFLKDPIRLHSSVVQRLRTATDGYGPNNLPPTFRIVGGIDGVELPEEMAYASEAERQAVRARMLELGDRIKLRRFFYFIGIFVAALIALKPFWPQIPWLNDYNFRLDPGIKPEQIEAMLSGWLPSYAGIWTSAFAGDPITVLLLLLVFAAASRLGMREENRMIDISRSIWRARLAGASEPVPERPGVVQQIARFVHASVRLQSGLAWLKWQLWPWAPMMAAAVWTAVMWCS
jgi:uncharacterized protein (DUF2235 family)